MITCLSNICTFLQIPSRDCVPLANLLGVIFQIRDDYQNLKNDIYNVQKGMCEDITEGKFSFPIIHSIRSSPDNTQLLSVLKQRSNDSAVKGHAVKILETTDSFSHCREVLEIMIARARCMVEEMNEGKEEKGIDCILDVLKLD